MVVYAIMAILATWRASSAVAEENGPGGTFQELRTWTIRLGLWVHEGISCVWCVSWWIGCGIAALSCALSIVPWEQFPVWWMGLSGGAIIIHTTLQRLVRP